MLATFTSDNWISILGIVVPLVAAVLAITWKWQAKQDTQINNGNTRVAVIETKVEGDKEELAAKIRENKEDLERGKERFTTIAGEIGKQNVTLAGLTVQVGNLTHAQAGVDEKLGQVLERLGKK